MRENIKAISEDYNSGFFRTYWYLEWIPEHIDEGVTIPGTYAEVPVPFQGRVFNRQKATKRQKQIINAFMSTDVLEIVETRENHPFKREDLILADLDTYPNGKVNKRGVPFKNFTRVRDIDNNEDAEMQMNQARFYLDNNNEKITVLFTT